MIISWRQNLLKEILLFTHPEIVKQNEYEKWSVSVGPKIRNIITIRNRFYIILSVFYSNLYFILYFISVCFQPFNFNSTRESAASIGVNTPITGHLESICNQM